MEFGDLKDLSKTTETFISKNFINIFKKIKELYQKGNITLVLEQEVKTFFNKNIVLFETETRDTPESWTNSEKQAFYNFTHNNIHKDLIIDAFNEHYFKENENNNNIKKPKYLIEYFRKIEEITNLLNAYQYNDKQFAKFIIKEMIDSIYLDDSVKLDVIYNALHVNIDKKTLTHVLGNNQINKSSLYNPARFNYIQNFLKVKDVEEKKDSILNKSGALMTAAMGVCSMNFELPFNYLNKTSTEEFSSGINALESIDKAIHKSNYIADIFDKTSVSLMSYISPLIEKAPNFLHGLDYRSLAITGLICTSIYFLKPVVTSFLKSFYKQSTENKILGMEPKKHDKDMFISLAKNRLLDTFVKRDKFDTHNENNVNHLMLTGFLANKLTNPLEKIEDYKTNDGKSLVDKLGLNPNEIIRINSLSIEDINELSYLKDPSLRDFIIKNKISDEKFICIKNIDLISQFFGYGLAEKNGHYLEDISVKNTNLNAELVQEINEKISPINKVIMKSLINLFGKPNKEKNQLIVNKHAFIIFTKEMENHEFFKESIENLYSQDFLLIEKIRTNGFKTHDNVRTLEKIMDSCNQSLNTYNNSEVREYLNGFFEQNNKKSLMLQINKTYSDEDSRTYVVGNFFKNKTTDIVNSFRSQFNSPMKPSI